MYLLCDFSYWGRGGSGFAVVIRLNPVQSESPKTMSPKQKMSYASKIREALNQYILNQDISEWHFSAHGAVFGAFPVYTALSLWIDALEQAIM